MSDFPVFRSRLNLFFLIYSVVALVVTLAVHFALYFAYLDIVGGHHVIVFKGHLVKSISLEELPRYQAYEARRYSGHWMICNVVLCILAFATLTLATDPKRKSPSDAMKNDEGLKDASHLYEVERRARYGERPGFRISELQISPTQKVPWHFHNHIDDTFYVIEGNIRLFLRNPDEEVQLAPGASHCVKAGRPHLVTNIGNTSATFLVLQGIGEYDYVPLV